MNAVDGQRLGQVRHSVATDSQPQPKVVVLRAAKRRVIEADVDQGAPSCDHGRGVDAATHEELFQGVLWCAFPLTEYDILVSAITAARVGGEGEVECRFLREQHHLAS